MRSGEPLEEHGAVVVDVHEYDRHTNGEVHGHVLCVRDHPFHPFVIWSFWEKDDGSKDVFSGTYLSSLEDAMAKWTTEVISGV